MIHFTRCYMPSICPEIRPKSAGHLLGIQKNDGCCLKSVSIVHFSQQPLVMRAVGLLAAIALACLATLSVAGELNPRDYERSQVLSSFMTIHWNVDFAANNITIAVEAQTTGTPLGL